MRHATARIGNCDCPGFVIRRNGDPRSKIGLMNGFARRLIESQLFAGIRRIGNQFAHKDFFVRVQRMDDDVQQLLNLRLKMMRFRFAHEPDFIANETGQRQEGDELIMLAGNSQVGSFSHMVTEALAIYTLLATEL